MLLMIGSTAAILFFLLWRLGVFDELMISARSRRGDIKKPDRTLPRERTENRDLAKRLEIFEEFFDGLSDEDETS